MKESAMRVAYFAGTMRPGHDGVTRVLYRLIEDLREREIENMFISPIVPPPGERPTTMLQVPAVSFPLYPDYRCAIPGYRHFERQVLAFRPHLLHINSPCPLGSAAVRFGRRYGIPVVATYHTHFTSYAKYYRIRGLEPIGWNYLRNLYNGCDRVFVPSLPILSELAARGFRNLEFLPHGVDTQAFNPAYRTPAWKARLGIEGKTALLYVGRLVWEKDLRTLAQAYEHVMASHDDAVFILVGDGPVRNDLERLMPRAVFLGHQSGDALATAYASSDLFVFPSTTETFGNVTLEAMASGIPPICVREGGAYGVITEGVTGLVAKPRDAADLAARINLLIEEPGRRAELGDQALTFARRQTWERIFDRLFAGYEDVVNHHVGRRRHRHRRAA
jgi:glycosyltransferase involved in cell wall biosynthesis